MMMSDPIVSAKLLFLVIISGLQGSYIHAQSHSPCKMYNHTSYDCQGRYFHSIPILPAKQMTVLELQYNSLTVITNYSFHEHPELEEIDLSHNDLVVIEEFAFSGLRNLTTLSLAVNMIEYLQENAFRDLKQLQKLYLDRNRFHSIPRASLAMLPELITLNIIIQDVIASWLSPSIDMQIASIDNILTITLTNSSFTNLPNLSKLTTIYGPSPLKHLAKLSVQCVMFNQLKSVNSKLRHLTIDCQVPTPIASRQSLKYLHRFKALEFLTLANEIVSIEAAAFSWAKTLKQLDLSYNQILHISSTAFTNLTHLETLDLSSNHLQNISSFAFINLPNLKFLMLSDNSLLRIQYGTFINLVGLETLNFHGNNIQNISSGAFINLPTLKFMKLSHNNLRHIQYETFINMVGLETLDLHDNNIQNISSGAFLNLRKLFNLDLSHNRIQQVQSDAFDGLTNLKTLDLSSNQIQYVSGNDTHPFGASSNLTNLILDGNPLSDKFLRTELNLNHLAYLSLVRTNITDYRRLFQFPVLRTLRINTSTFQPPLTGDMLPASLCYLDIILAPSRFYDTPIDLDLSLFKNLSDVRLVTEDRIKTCVYIHMPSFCNSTSLTSLEITNMCPFNRHFPFIYFPNLIKLVLRQLLLKSIPDNFKITNIEHLDLSHNNIKVIYAETMVTLTKLRFLDLSNNQLASMTFVKPLISTLVHLDLNENSIANIPVDIFQNASNLQYVDMSGNPFECSCQSGVTHFNAWFDKDTAVYVGEVNNYLCSNSLNLTGTVLMNIKLDCAPQVYTTIINTTLNFPLILGANISLIVVIAIIVFISIRCYWRIRYKLFKLRHRRRHDDFIDENDLDNIVDGNFDAAADDDMDHKAARPLRFDAYVAYHDNDEDWVLDDLIKHIEGEYLTADGEVVQNDEQEERMVLHIPQRDTVAGQPRIAALTDAIQRSTKTILVLSRSFMACEWCYMQTQVAFEMLFAEGRDVIILVLLEDIPYEQMTRELRKLLRRKRYLKWPDDPVGRRLFWGRLRQKIKKPALVDRRFEI